MRRVVQSYLQGRKDTSKFLDSEFEATLDYMENPVSTTKKGAERRRREKLICFSSKTSL